MSDHPCMRIDTYRVTPCSLPHCLHCGGGYRHDTELSNVTPLRAEFPAPKGKPMDNYRRDSGAWTGYAPRSVEQRWPSPPRAIESGWFVRLVRRIFGR